MKIARYLNYRTEIDGLRAIAVGSVVLYHAEIMVFGRDWFKGGFIGVDIFFVISGYLITRLILSELEQTNTLSILNFYERRARRILPMLVLIVALCSLYGFYKLNPFELIELTKSSLAAFAFISNFYFYLSTTEYSALNSQLMPLLHTWSLSVEEQFYLIAPILFFIIWKLFRAALASSSVVAILLSLEISDAMNNINQSLNFYSPISRSGSCFWLFIGVFRADVWTSQENGLSSDFVTNWFISRMPQHITFRLKHTTSKFLHPNANFRDVFNYRVFF